MQGEDIVGVLTNFGQIIPVKREKLSDIKSKFPVLDKKYYYDADLFLSKKEPLEINDAQKWNDEINKINKNIMTIKKILGSEISNDLSIKNTILNIVKDLSISKLEKIKKIKDIFSQILLKKNISFTDIEISDICNEVINDNIENLLLNNVVLEQVYNPNEIKHVDTESIWMNINDITNWFKKYESS